MKYYILIITLFATLVSFGQNNESKTDSLNNNLELVFGLPIKLNLSLGNLKSFNLGLEGYPHLGLRFNNSLEIGVSYFFESRIHKGLLDAEKLEIEKRTDYYGIYGKQYIDKNRNAFLGVQYIYAPTKNERYDWFTVESINKKQKFELKASSSNFIVGGGYSQKIIGGLYVEPSVWLNLSHNSSDAYKQEVLDVNSPNSSSNTYNIIKNHSSEFNFDVYFQVLLSYRFHLRGTKKTSKAQNELKTSKTDVYY